MEILEQTNYRNILRNRLTSLGKGGRGGAKFLAQQMNVNPSILSQIMSGTKNLTIDQALDAADCLGLDDLETEYFISLVILERTPKLKNKRKLSQKVVKLRARALDMDSRLSATEPITEDQKGIFYSRWYYSAIRLMTPIPKFSNVEAISEHLRLPMEKVREALQFLCKSGLVANVNSKFALGPKTTHIRRDHPLVSVHHQNWRSKAVEKSLNNNSSDLFFTCPMVISEKDCEKVLSILTHAVKEIDGLIETSENEKMVCMNIDFFEV